MNSPTSSVKLEPKDRAIINSGMCLIEEKESKKDPEELIGSQDQAQKEKELEEKDNFQEQDNTCNNLPTWCGLWQ